MRSAARSWDLCDGQREGLQEVEICAAAGSGSRWLGLGERVEKLQLARVVPRDRIAQETG